ncbi:hypothetical protein KJ707_03590 [Patescibacteria group bacterium]|nr:hypothetical protein [Patescibacteria group bacterium]
MTEQEQEHIRQAKERLFPYFNAPEVQSVSELKARIQEARDAVSAGINPLDTTQTISPADRGFYLQAIAAIEADLIPIFTIAENMIERLIDKGVGSPEMLADKMAAVSRGLHARRDALNYNSQLMGAERAARLYRKFFFEEERSESFDEERWGLGLWGAYKTYAAGHDETGAVISSFNKPNFIRTEVTRLQAAGWSSVTDQELLKIFYGQNLLERRINGCLFNPSAMNSLTRDEIEEIRKNINEYKTLILDTSAVTETQVFYNRLVIMHHNLERAWLADVDDSFMEQAEQAKMLSAERVQYGQFLLALNQLNDLLQSLKTDDRYLASPGEVDENIRTELQRLSDILTGGERFLEHKKISADNRERLRALYARLIEESKVFLGTQVGETVFFDRDGRPIGDLDWWMFTHHGQQWRAVQFFWEQYHADGTPQAVNLNPKYKQELGELVNYFINHMRILDSSDRAFHQRFIALDIQVNRLQEMLRVMGEVADVLPGPLGPIIPNGPEDTPDGDLPRPNTESQAAYDEWLKKRLELAELNPEIYNRILHEIHELIIERLHNIKEVSKQWKDFPLLEAYALIYKYLEIDPASLNVAVMTEIKIKSEEIEKIRTITDVAHEHGMSRAMVSNWEGFKDHEGANGLSPLYYDYFCQEWGDGETRENGEANRYKHALLMNKTIYAYLEWLRFGEGHGWSDGPLWKAKAKEFCMNFAEAEATANGTVLSDYEKDEFYDLLYNMVYGLGIRQHSFIDQHTVGSTPAGDLGAQWHYVADTQFIPTFWYNVYKEAEFLPVEGIFDVPAAWLQRCQDAGLVEADRITNINRSRKLTRQVMEIFGPPRKPAKIGLKRSYDGIRPINFEGRDLATAYDTLFEAVFLKAKARKEQRDDPHKEYDFTFPSFIYGHEAYVDFRKAFMGVPGNLFGKFDKDTPHKEIQDKVIEAVDSKKPEELITILSNDYKFLINKHFSYLKKNWFSVDPNQVAYAILGYIDRMFRIMSLSGKVTLQHRYKLLSEIRKITRDGANMTGLCKRDEIYGVDPHEPIAWKKYSSMDEHGATSEVTRDLAKYDVRDFILNRLPNTAEDYEGRNAIARMLKPIATIADAPITIVGGFNDRQRIAPPAWDNPAHHGTDRIKLWWSLRKAGISDTFRRTMYYAFGVPEAAQKSPDAK